MNGKHVGTNVQHVPIKGAAYMMSLCECDGYNPKSRPIQRISVFLFKDQVATLRAIHEATGVPASILIRQGVDWAIQQHEQPKAKWVVKRRRRRT